MGDQYNGLSLFLVQAMKNIHDHPPGLAAVIIGEALFGKIFHNFGFRLLGVALGSIVYYFVLQIVIWLGIDTDLLKLLSAAVVAVFLAIPYWQSKYFSRPVKRGGDR